MAKCCMMLVAMDAQEATLEQEQETPFTKRSGLIAC